MPNRRMAGQALCNGRVFPPQSETFRPLGTAELLAGHRDSKNGDEKCLSAQRGDALSASQGEESGGMKYREEGGAGAETEEKAGEREAERIAWEKAQEIIEEAKREAQEILARAEVEKQAEIEASVARVVEEARARVRRLVEQMEKRWEELEEELAEQIGTIAIEIARKIIVQELETRPELIKAMVLEAIRKVGGGGSMRVFVSPEDAKVLEGVLEELESGAGGKVEVVVDEGLQSGDIVVESANGEVDARLDTQLSIIEEQIRDVSNGSGLAEAA